MSRSGYSEDCDGWALIRWRGAVNSAIKGARGQAFLRELAAALDAMPDKRLIADELETADGEFCTIGVLGAARGVDMSKIDPEDREAVAAAFNIAPALAAEIVFENDEGLYPYDFVTVEVCGPLRRFEQRTRSLSVPKSRLEEQRWHRMRQWVESHIKATGEKA